MAITDSTRNMIEKLVDRVNKLIDKAESLSAGLEALDDKVNNLPPSTIVRTGLLNIASGSTYTSVPSEWTTDIETGSLCNLNIIARSTELSDNYRTMGTLEFNYIWNVQVSFPGIVTATFQPSVQNTANASFVIASTGSSTQVGYVVFGEPYTLTWSIGGRVLSQTNATTNKVLHIRWYLTIIPPA